MAPADDSLTPDDIAARRIHRTLAGPKPPANALGLLIPSTTCQEAPDSPETARYRRRSQAQRTRRQLEQLARLTAHPLLIAALTRHRAIAPPRGRTPHRTARHATEARPKR